MLGIKQVFQNKAPIDNFKYPALFLGPGKYAQGVSNSSLNNFTAFTMSQTFNYTDLAINGGQVYDEFNILKNNNSSIYAGNDTAGAGLQFYGLTSDIAMICTGSTKSLNITTTTDIHKTTFSSRARSPIITKVLTADASSNSYTVHIIASCGTFKNSTTVHTQTSGSYTFTNWGTFDTDGFVSIGAYRQTGEDQVTSNANCTSSHGFLRAQLWNSVLTDQQILNTVGGDGTVFSMPSYSEGNYPQPNHEWKIDTLPTLNKLTIPDTGSDTAINLSIYGLAKVGYYPFRA